LYRAFDDPATNVVHALLASAAIGCVVFAVVARRYLPSGAWAFGGLAATFFGWYVPWGLPYAVLERRWAAGFLISLPALTFLLATWYGPSPTSEWTLKLALLAAPLVTYAVVRRQARTARA
jgi:hypothetical protein